MSALLKHQQLISQSAARRWWRVLITACDTSTIATSADYLSMRTVAGGAQAAVGGTAFADSQYDASHPPSAAFSGTGPDTNIWASTNHAQPWYLGYQFPVPVDIVQIAMTVRSDGATYGQGWKDFSIQRSGDSTTGLDGTWEDVWFVAGQTGWTSGQTRVFTKP